ncbi:hypothetical protein PLANPX_5068 [Lacipirellula parvula]|uniref:Uncharacterized protein n=1 Tax=Lacipirellula parvula TaxID=2650471 RepID=A0A5K7XLE8_9BACT|nr:hypothetical protein PLANPX_5068 [Lacipirellula parvula]
MPAPAGTVTTKTDFEEPRDRLLTTPFPQIETYRINWNL